MTTDDGTLEGAQDARGCDLSDERGSVGVGGPTCSIEGCATALYCKGWCEKHYYRWRRHGDPTIVLPRTAIRDPRERFWEKVDKRSDSECWIYKGTILNTGYGQISFGRHHRISTHRFAYEDVVGPIPDGLTIDHLCCVRACVNPSHMEAVSQSENSKRVHQRARGEHV